MGEWANGRMGEWASGRVGEWASGRVGEWAREVRVIIRLCNWCDTFDPMPFAAFTGD